MVILFLVRLTTKLNIALNARLNVLSTKIKLTLLKKEKEKINPAYAGWLVWAGLSWSPSQAKLVFNWF